MFAVFLPAITRAPAANSHYPPLTLMDRLIVLPWAKVSNELAVVIAPGDGGVGFVPLTDSPSPTRRTVSISENSLSRLERRNLTVSPKRGMLRLALVAAQRR